MGVALLITDDKEVPDPVTVQPVKSPVSNPPLVKEAHEDVDTKQITHNESNTLFMNMPLFVERF